MKRKAILIFNDGGPENYLPGVSIDKENYLKFLKSPEGGAWDEDSEIKVYDNNCTKEWLMFYIKNCRLTYKPGYWLIVFSGHGYSTEKDEVILELSLGNECAVKDIEKATEYSRRLLIADSCRTVFHNISESVKSRVKLFSSHISDTDYIKKCRDLYMQQLEEVYSNSFNAVFAAGHNQEANDDDITGGYYSFELLKAAQECVEYFKGAPANKDHVACVDKIHAIASNRVDKRTNGSQTPVHEGYYLNKLPFVVVPK